MFYDSAHMQNLSDQQELIWLKANEIQNDIAKLKKSVITWMGGPIVYVSKRHTLVGLSSAEDEYMTLTHAYKWVNQMWLRNLLIKRDGL